MAEDAAGDVCWDRVCCRRDGAAWTLTLTRCGPHRPDRVWAALTDAGLLARWAPDCPGLAVTAEPPDRLAWAGPDDTVRWELAAAGAGCTLTLRHTFVEGAWAGELAAHWHRHLDRLDALLDPERAPGPAPSWLAAGYAERLALAAPLTDLIP